jgi:hypothetical protein
LVLIASIIAGFFFYYVFKKPKKAKIIFMNKILDILHAFLAVTDIRPANVENREINIIISLSIGLLILIIDKKTGSSY